MDAIQLESHERKLCTARYARNTPPVRQHVQENNPPFTDQTSQQHAPPGRICKNIMNFNPIAYVSMLGLQVQYLTLNFALSNEVWSDFMLFRA